MGDAAVKERSSAGSRLTSRAREGLSTADRTNCFSAFIARTVAMAVSTLRGTLLSRATADLVEIVRVLHERMEPSDHVGVEHESANTL